MVEAVILHGLWAGIVFAVLFTLVTMAWLMFLLIAYSAIKEFWDKYHAEK